MICVDVGYLMLEFENDLTFYLLAAAGKYINRCKNIRFIKDIFSLFEYAASK